MRQQRRWRRPACLGVIGAIVRRLRGGGDLARLADPASATGPRTWRCHRHPLTVGWLGGEEGCDGDSRFEGWWVCCCSCWSSSRYPGDGDSWWPAGVPGVLLVALPALPLIAGLVLVTWRPLVPGASPLWRRRRPAPILSLFQRWGLLDSSGCPPRRSPCASSWRCCPPPPLCNRMS